jgi:hypothetical protein
MNYKIAQFILTPTQNNQSLLEIYVAQPDANKETLAGKLFALIEIESSKADSIKVINFLINTLNHNYYQNEKMILRERVSTIKIEHIFESALAKTNKRLAEFLQTEKIKLDPSVLNITIGVVYNDSLHFANLGKNKALLIYKSKTDDNAKYKLADITEQTGIAEKKQPSLIKLFSNVISGALPRGGYFIFASETFAEYLSAKQIINITTTLPPASAAEQIRNTLSQINAYVPFLGIIIKNTSGLEIQEIKIKKPIASTKDSIDNLIITEEKTEKLLTPSGIINTRKWSSFFNNLFGHISLSRGSKIDNQAFLLKDKIFTKKKAGWLSIKKIFYALKGGLIYLISLLIYVYRIITDKKTLLDFFSNLNLKTKKLWQTARLTVTKSFFWYIKLNKINKILFSAVLICILIFSINLGWQSIKNKKIENQAVISNLIVSIEQKQNQIEASLLYSNEDGAKKLLGEVKDLLDQLPQNNQSQIEQYNILAAKYKVHIEKISRVIRFNPIELADFSKLNPNAKPANIIFSNGKIYAADASQKSIFTVDLKSKVVSVLDLSNQNIKQLDFGSLDKNNNIYYLSSNSLSILDSKTEKLSDLKINYNGDLQKISDLKQYNNRFYLIDTSAGQIFRLTKSGDTLDNATAWLNDKENLATVVSLGIDGEIYLLKSNGEINKYAKGKKQDFTVSTVEPLLSQTTKIIVSPEQDYFYILEPINKRLVVFDKTGKFINQYTSDRLDNLKDFQIDEINKKIYLLNNATIYSVDLVIQNK